MKCCILYSRNYALLLPRVTKLIHMEIVDRNLKNKCLDSIHILPSSVKNLAGISVPEKYNILFLM